jgi:cell wall-associated NlpC family hydrolase
VPQLAASASSDPLAGATPVTVISTSSVSSVSTVSTSSSNGTLGQQILADAETRAGAPYVWGGNGPWAFDCSGLVVWAAKQEGVILPRTTYDMLGRGVAQGQLVRISADEAEPGDLAFFGPGHVEFVAGLSATFGAHHRNTVVSLRTYSQDYAPTMFFRVVG